MLLAIASATFASARPEVGLSFDHAQPPAHAPMEDSPVVLHSGLEPVFCRNFEYRFAGGSPPFSLGDPAAFVSAWLVIATGFSEFAKKIYDLILSRLPILAGPD